jgi:hypothetical protein
VSEKTIRCRILLLIGLGLAIPTSWFTWHDGFRAGRDVGIDQTNIEWANALAGPEAQERAARCRAWTVANEESIRKSGLELDIPDEC